MAKKNFYTADVKEDTNGDLYIELSDEIMEDVGWVIGDTLEWKQNDDHTWTLSKKD